MPPASFTRLNTASIPALILTPQLATAPVRSSPAPRITSLSVTPSSPRAGTLPPRTRRPTRADRAPKPPRSLFMESLLSCALLMPEVRSANVVVPQELPTVSCQRDRSGLQHVTVVGDGQGLVGVLLDEQHGGAVVVNLANDAKDLLHEHRGQAERGLVQKHQPGLRHQRAPDRQHLLLAPAEGPRQLQ